MAAGPNLPVLGSGSVGRLTKWTGFTSSNSFIGDSGIFEDKNGLVGIGTITPTSKLTVAGLIESSGPGSGFKFPDGTIQSTAGLSTIFHDATLAGDGTSASPLGVAVPLTLTGAVNNPFSLLSVINTGVSGQGVFIRAGSATGNGLGGTGAFVFGGNSESGFAGTGADVRGGNSESSDGGSGIDTSGGSSFSGDGGDGVVAFGGNGTGAGNNGGIGILARGGLGINDAINGLAGKFDGDVEVTGNLSKATGSFKIDHPLDPANKYLYHSFVESPDMKNIYDGVVSLDRNGEATIELPEWFEALNKDFRYLLTPIGAPGPGLYIAEKISKNRFKIAGGQPGIEVSWQVTGIRKDAYANAHRIRVEENKPERERGYYLHPELFDQPEEKQIEWARNPELMQRLKQKQR
jgi:hypothetical protein